MSIAQSIECPKECADTPKVKGVILVKKGMAAKAFKKYAENGDIKNMERQMKKGVLSYI